MRVEDRGLYRRILPLRLRTGHIFNTWDIRKRRDNMEAAAYSDVRSVYGPSSWRISVAGVPKRMDTHLFPTQRQKQTVEHMLRYGLPWQYLERC